MHFRIPIYISNFGIWGSQYRNLPDFRLNSGEIQANSPEVRRKSPIVRRIQAKSPESCLKTGETAKYYCKLIWRINLGHESGGLILQINAVN